MPRTAERQRQTQLEGQLQAIQCMQQRLLKENAELHGVVGSLEWVARQQSQDHLSRVLQRLHPLFDDTGPPALQTSKVYSVKELLQLLPLSVLSAMAPSTDKHLHRSVMSLTPAAAAQHWGQAVRDLKMLLYLHTHDPAAAHDDLSRCINELTRWSCAVYMFNPSVLQQLAGVNLQTMRQTAVPTEHWQAAWESAELSGSQRRQLVAVTQFLTPKLLNLDAERRQLAAKLADLDAAAAAASAPSPDSNGTVIQDSGTSDIRNSHCGSIEQRRWDTAQQLARVNSAWRVLIQLRSQLVVAILEPWQAAQVVVSVYPYMLLGSPLYQHLEPEPVALPCASSTAGQVAAADTAAATEIVVVVPGTGQLSVAGPVRLAAGLLSGHVTGQLASGHCPAAGVLSSGEVFVGGAVVGDNFTGVQAVGVSHTCQRLHNVL